MFGYKPKPNFTVENEAQIPNAPNVDFDRRRAAAASAAGASPRRNPRRRAIGRTRLTGCAHVARDAAVAGAAAASRLGAARSSWRRFPRWIRRWSTPPARSTPPQKQRLDAAGAGAAAAQGQPVAGADGADHAARGHRAVHRARVRAWKLGRKGVDDGVLVVVAKDDRTRAHRAGLRRWKARSPTRSPTASIQRIHGAEIPRRAITPAAWPTRPRSWSKLIDGETAARADGRQRSRRASGGGGDWLFALFAAFIVARSRAACFGVPAARAARR